MDRGNDPFSALAPTTPLRIPWTVIAIASAAAGVVVALVAVPGVRATTGASAATAIDEGVARGAMAAIPVAVALYACRRPAHVRFGGLLLGFSVVWWLSLLSSSSSSVVYTVGRVSSFASVLFLVLAILAFPSGRFESLVDRALAASGVAIVVVLFLPTTVLVDQYPLPFPFASCDAGCPHNAFMVSGHEPQFISGVVAPVRDFLVTVVVVLVAVRLWQRIRRANTLVRQTLAPLLVASITWLLLYAGGLVIRRIAPHSVTTHVVMWLFGLAVTAIMVAFLVGIARWHLFVTAAMHHATARLQGLPRPEQVRDVLAEVFGDPKLQIARWLRQGRHWVRVDGEPLETPAPNSGRWLTEIRDRDLPVVAIEHDAVLRDEQVFIDTADCLARIAFESEHLFLRTRGALRELRASRARLLAAADGERRRIAQDLHDGAQQRLVALRIELELEAEKVEHDNPDEAATLREFGAQIENALEDFRSMTRGIYPAILSDRGIADAVRAAALNSPVPTTVEAEDLTECPREIATAVYFCCLEALQNVAKHAGGATAARIALCERNSVLRFSVSDDGAGFRADRARLGAGMINMRDRVSVVGGELTIHSAPGRGTKIAGRVPLTAGTSPGPGARDSQAWRTSRPHLRRDHAQ
jgi:signal transduction histidine kinase